METLFSGLVRPVGNYRAKLGESPVWCSQSRSLLWVDILQRRLLLYWPKRDAIEQRSLAPLLSAALLTERREQFLLVSDQGILLYHWEDCQAPPALLCPYPRDAAGTRPNEAAIAPDGSLWFSTTDVNEAAPLGGWYWFAPGDSRPVKMAGAMTIPNTLAWHEDRVWFADSAEQLFFSASGLGILPQEMRSHAADDMTPDGSALSHEGDLINARLATAVLAATVSTTVRLRSPSMCRCRSRSPAAAPLAAPEARRCLLPRRVSCWRPPASWTAHCCRSPPAPAGRQPTDSGSINPRLGRVRRYESVGQKGDDGITPPSSRRPAALSALQRRYFPRGR
ncbi:SMP-30/gluconolactonase/LRE family protein [Sodalis praecaptivus]|uniref:SMP-30/gluconolactonase/LRE family protein n=1 Tax=Sodalis praecaptivus TaxID=1239307 RepID=UPI0027FEEBCB|nr:hypothetical protein NVIRENTERO_03067 [Sodalis praecaptivus]